QTVTLETSYKRIKGTQDATTNSGATVTSVTLQSSDGLILLRLTPVSIPTSTPTATAEPTATPTNPPTKPTPVGMSNITVARPAWATASSTQSSAYPATAAFDGNTTTRWSSAFSDPQWIQIDLGATFHLSSVILNWETAYGKSYVIKTSSDGVNW